MVSVSTSVPVMKATPRMTATPVSKKRALLARMVLEGEEHDQPPRVFMRSKTESDVGSCELVDDATVGEEHRAVGVGRGDRVVGDHHDRLAELAHGLAHEGEDLGAGAGVEVAGGLVGEDDLRPAGECPGDGDALLLTAGELRRAVAASRFRETDGLDDVVDPRAGRACGRRASSAA